MKNKKTDTSKQYYTETTLTFDKLLWPMSTILSAVIIACAVLFTGIIVSRDNLTKKDIQTLVSSIGTNSGTGTTTNTGTAQQQQTVTMDQVNSLYAQGNVVFGDSSRKVTFVEFADPSCPYCHAAAGKNPELNNQIGTQFKLASEGGSYYAPVPEMKKLVDEGKASYIWLYTYGHGNGELGAQALYCAYEKGKFWEVHDLLMTSAGYTLLNETVKNDKANAGKLADFVKTAIDPEFLKQCLESSKYAQKIQDDEETAASLGINGTPGYFVNTTVFAGAYNFTDMKPIVDEALD